MCIHKNNNHRTKHYISSPNLPIQLLALDILESGLQFVRNYEDELLPMIHQNWYGLVRIFAVDNDSGSANLSDSKKLVACKAIKVFPFYIRITRKKFR